MEFDYDSGELGEIQAPDFTSIQTPGLSHAVKSLDSHYYNDEVARWQKYQNTPQSTKGQKTLSFLSWNLWCGKSSFEIRTNEVAKIIVEHSPDVIALHQANAAILRILQKVRFIRDHYYLSDFDGSTLSPVGVLFLVKFPFSEITLRPLVSRTGREILIAQIRLNKTDIWINGACLESRRQSSEMRLNQAQSTNMKIANQENSFLLLSANSWGEEETRKVITCYRDFTDAWIQVHPDSKDCTIDTTSNEMINREIKLKNGVPQRRHDRADFVLYKSKIWHPISARLVGTSPIETPSLTKSEGQAVEARMEVLERKEQPEVETASEKSIATDLEKLKVSNKSSNNLGPIYPSIHYGVFVEFSC